MRLLILTAVGLFAGTAAFASPGGAAHSHPEFSAGELGDAKKPARTIQIVMREADGKMLFIPDRVEVAKGEQVKFVLRNSGDLDHEFVLATPAENLKHAEEMKKNPDMEHDDPNARRVVTKKAGDLVWKFTKTGLFEYGCLIPGHRESGMIGTIVVK